MYRLSKKDEKILYPRKFLSKFVRVNQKRERRKKSLTFRGLEPARNATHSVCRRAQTNLFRN